MGIHHFLWGRSLKTGDDYKEDGDKEQGRGDPKLCLMLSGKEENRHPDVRVLHVFQQYLGDQNSSLLPKLVQVMSLNLETMSNQKGLQSPILGLLGGGGEGTRVNEHKGNKG